MRHYRNTRKIGHFRVLLCLCFKTSGSAKPFFWKWAFMQFHFHANQSRFHKNSFALRLALKQRHKGTRKWPIVKVILSNYLIVHKSNRSHGMVSFRSNDHEFTKSALCNFIENIISNFSWYRMTTVEWINFFGKRHVFISQSEARHNICVWSLAGTFARFQLAIARYMNDWACQYCVNSVSFKKASTGLY